MAKVIRLNVGDLEEIDVIAVGDAASGDLTGTFPGPTLAAFGAGAATYSGGISAITVDAKGRVSAVTGGGGGSVPTITATNSSGSSIAAGKAVNIYNNSGTPTMRLADSGTSNNYPVHGFTTAAVANGASGTVQVSGVLNVSGITNAAGTGVPYYHDPASRGDITTTPTNTANERVQRVGFGAGADYLVIEIELPIKQA